MSNKLQASRWTPRVTVAAIVDHEDSFLMVREQVNGESVCSQPAGHLENRETLVDAVIREVLEEAGLVFVPQELVGVYRWAMSDETTYLRFLFTGTVEGSIEPAPRDPAIESAMWVPRHQILSDGFPARSPQVIAGLKDYLAGQRLPLSLLKDIN